MTDQLFVSQRLIGREAELLQIRQILAKDEDFLLVGVPGIGRRTLIRVAAQQVGAKVLEIDCLRTTSASRFLRLLADSILEGFSTPEELVFIQQWSTQQPLVLEQSLSQRPQLVWHLSAAKEWMLFQSLLALPQSMAEWLGCRVVIVFLNFPHIRSWDRTGKWEEYLRQEIQQQSRVSYVLVSTVIESWVQQHNLHTIALAPLSDSTIQSWIVAEMADQGLEFDADSQALDLFISIVQGHTGDAIRLARRIWFDRRFYACSLPDWTTASKSELNSVINPLIEAHHVHRSALALVEDLATTFESLILLLPPSQVRVLESLALDPTDKPQSRDYIQKHQLTRGGGLQGALAGLEQKGLLYGPQYGYRVALPFLSFWLKQRLL
ncbi:ATP-binding protein [Leptolyngbya sp. NK1-12]|uniref:ATP-binding protein n=1 Tax=Leptolyngbya sp. NK1-12 TaxID=2547451 RepID=A0AA96WLM5_9CYAN|nr:ATP-binding protein [Leptolyngbya sp. NK1-12]WNZ23576.1 ATP-binding protein [Leptolyngbya sp. NK1-12]